MAGRHRFNKKRPPMSAGIIICRNWYWFRPKEAKARSGDVRYCGRHVKWEDSGLVTTLDEDENGVITIKKKTYYCERCFNQQEDAGGLYFHPRWFKNKRGKFCYKRGGR